MKAVEVDLASPVPPYEQVRRRIADLVDTGELPEGTRLPGIRQLAADLGLAPGTIARAYRELEAGHYVRSRAGRGSTVLAAPHPRAALHDAARALAEEARRGGHTPEDAHAALDAALREATTIT